MRDHHQTIADHVMLASLFAEKATWSLMACAWIFGRHRTFDHVGYRIRTSTWRGRPYLLTMRELRT